MSDLFIEAKKVSIVINRLEENKLISRVPGQPRSIRLLIPPEQLPLLK